MTEIIDLTDRYFDERWMKEGPAAWVLKRATEPIEGIVWHHAAGWYGPDLSLPVWSRVGEEEVRQEEVSQLDKMAQDHRVRFDIGPGYHYCSFPSDRVYAIGKMGTHRAHVLGKIKVEDPGMFAWANRRLIGILAMGHWHEGELPDGTRRGMEAATREVFSFAGEQPVYGHRGVDVYHENGDPWPEHHNRICPGDQLEHARMTFLAKQAASGGDDEQDVGRPMPIANALGLIDDAGSAMTQAAFAIATGRRRLKAASDELGAP